MSSIHHLPTLNHFTGRSFEQDLFTTTTTFWNDVFPWASVLRCGVTEAITGLAVLAGAGM